ERRNGFAHQRDLFRIIELRAKGAGGSRRGERAQRRPLLQYYAFQPSARGVKRRGRAQDAAADDDAVGGRGRIGGEVQQTDIVKPSFSFLVSRFSGNAGPSAARSFASLGRAPLGMTTKKDMASMQA